MANATDLEIKSFIATCRGFYRAITEMDNVAAPSGGDLQREAYKATGSLQKTLDAALRDWNDGSLDPEDNLPRIVECAGNGSGRFQYWSSSATQDKCDVYTVENDSGLCSDCLIAKTKYEGQQAGGTHAPQGKA